MSLENDNAGRTVTIHQPEFLPWLGWLDKLRQCDVFVLLDSVQYEKNYFQNRNRIRASTGPIWLTVPVLTKGQSMQAICDVRIHSAENWRRKHLQSIQQNYGSAAFFNDYFPRLKEIYENAGEGLADFNMALIEWIAQSFGLNRRFVRSSTLDVGGKRSELLAGLCAKLDAKTYLSGVSGKDYLDETLFKAAGITVRYQDFRHPTYPQVYSPFTPLMSSVDLLFNTGPKALSLLTAANDTLLSVPRL